MDILEALLAFALLMVSFTTIVTVIVEMIQRVLKLRQKGLEMMLTRFFDDVLWPQAKKILEAKASAAGITVDEGNVRAAFLAKMLQRPELVTGGGFISRNAQQRSVLKPVDFIELLADTEIGKALQLEAKNIDLKLDQAIGALLQRYEQYGNAVSQFFKLRSQIVGLVISVGLAFVMNLDAALLYQHFASDPEARAAILEKEQEILAASEGVSKNQQQLSPGETTFEESRQKLKEQQALLASLSLPVGYEYAPWIVQSGSKKEPTLCVSLRKLWAWLNRDTILPFMLWFFSVFVTGLLIGLGGPFWYDTARKLSAIVGVARSAPGGGEPDKATAKKSPLELEKEQRAVAVERFKTAQAWGSPDEGAAGVTPAPGAGGTPGPQPTPQPDAPQPPQPPQSPKP